jgi:hypothetical protein
VTGPEVSVGDASAVEGDSGTRTLRFPISLSSAPGTSPVTVYWSTAPGTATSTDYVTAKGKLTFTGTQVMKFVSVSVRTDTVPEATKLMYLVAAGVDGGRNRRERGTGTIVDDDPNSGVNLAVADALVVEGNAGARSLVVPVQLTKPAAAPVTFHWSTVADTAAPGADYSSRSGTGKIALNGSVALLTIPIVPDGVAENPERFTVVVDSATNATILDGAGVVTILDDD